MNIWAIFHNLIFIDALPGMILKANFIKFLICINSTVLMEIELNTFGKSSSLLKLKGNIDG